MVRLTTEECALIAAQRLRDFDGLDAGDVLARFKLDRGPHEEEGAEGDKPYRCRIWAMRTNDAQVVLYVAVDPLPDVDRRGVLGLIDASRYGRHTRRSIQW